MESAFWDRVVAEGHKVPADRPLADLTAELTTMLGSTDPSMRDGIAFPTLATWVSEGVYDDLLEGLGDGMTAGLRVGHRRERHRHRVPPELLGAGPHGLPRPGHRARRVPRRRPRRRRAALGRPGRGLAGARAGPARATSPARGGRTRSPTAPTRWASWPRPR